MYVRTNADTPNDAKAARNFGAKGVGLCRTEHMFFEGEEPSYRRKPSVGMVEKYLNELLDRENSYVIGDRLSDSVGARVIASAWFKAIKKKAKSGI